MVSSIYTGRDIMVRCRSNIDTGNCLHWNPQGGLLYALGMDIAWCHNDVPAEMAPAPISSC